MKYHRAGKYYVLDEPEIFKNIDLGEDDIFLENFIYYSGRYKRLDVSAIYAWDGASGPAIDTKSIMRATLLHDVLYQLMREGLLDISYRKYADQLLKRIYLEDAPQYKPKFIPKFLWWLLTQARSLWIYWAVRIFAEKYAIS